MQCARLLPIFLLTAAAPAAANLRAPFFVDGKFGAHIDAEHAHPALELVRESFEASLPMFSVGDAPPAHARLIVLYDIVNSSSAPITLPVRFLALGARDVRIEVNQRLVEHHEVVDRAEWAAAADIIAAARCKGVEGCEPARVRQALDHWLERDQGSFDSIAFDAVFAPGRSTIRVAYAQALTIHEGSYGYFMRGTFGTRGARYGFDYLLFPATTWKVADDFRFDVQVEVPDTMDRGWLSTSFVPPETIQSTLPLTQTRAPHPSTTLRAQLVGFPVEVFTLTVTVPRG